LYGLISSEQVAEENIWIEEGPNNRKVEKVA
jgi:hypothetical protein